MECKQKYSKLDNYSSKLFFFKNGHRQKCLSKIRGKILIWPAALNLLIYCGKAGGNPINGFLYLSEIYNHMLSCEAKNFDFYEFKASPQKLLIRHANHILDDSFDYFTQFNIFCIVKGIE